MKLWVDDLRTPPEGWEWAKTVDEAISLLTANTVTHMSLDHDLGGEGMGATETSRPIVLWLCENDRWPVHITIHSWNPVGAEWLKGMCERYSPHQDEVPYIPSEKHWAGEEAVSGPAWGTVDTAPATGLDTISWYILTLHQLLGHDKASVALGQDPRVYDKADCIACMYEQGLATKDAVIERMGT